MKSTKEDFNKLLSTIRSSLLSYHNEIIIQYPSRSPILNLSSMSIPDIISSLQCSITSLIDSLLSSQQLEYETILQDNEKRIRAQYAQINQLKLQKEAMEKKIQTLCSKEEEYDNVRKNSGVVIQKENEILILRAENSNLKSILFKLEEKTEEYKEKIQRLEKQLADYKSTYNYNHNNNNNNININIKDICNSKVIIKTHSQYSLTGNKKNNKKKQINLSESNSNKNVFIGTYRSAFSSNRTTQGSQCVTKGNANQVGNKVFINGTINNNSSHYNKDNSNKANSNSINTNTANKKLIKDQGSFVNNSSRLWNSIQKDLGKEKKTNMLTKLLVSSLQGSHSPSANKNNSISLCNYNSNSKSSTSIVKKKKKLHQYKSPETFRHSSKASILKI